MCLSLFCLQSLNSCCLIVRTNLYFKLDMSMMYKLEFQYLSRCEGWVGGQWAGGGLKDNNAILRSVDVVVEVGVELGNIC